ncbi:MAG: hypothetical protein HY331_16125 [Chloroflexi bacterium]|nr:hypothetical protein [Chloroflexota bacterium]
MAVGTFLLMAVFAYGLGVFWYDLLPAKLPEQPWRIAAYPFALMVIGETFVPVGPAFGGINPITAVVATLIGVAIDWIITRLRHPQVVQSLETPRTATLPA